MALSDPESIGLNLTDDARCRLRRYYVLRLGQHVGLSSRFLGDAFGMDDSAVRRVLRSETARGFAMGSVRGHV